MFLYQPSKLQILFVCNFVKKARLLSLCALCSFRTVNEDQKKQKRFLLCCSELLKAPIRSIYLCLVNKKFFIEKNFLLTNCLSTNQRSPPMVTQHVLVFENTSSGQPLGVFSKLFLENQSKTKIRNPSLDLKSQIFLTFLRARNRFA